MVSITGSPSTETPLEEVRFDSTGAPNPLLFQNCVPACTRIGSDDSGFYVLSDERSPWVGLLSTLEDSKYILVESACDANGNLYTNWDKWPLLTLSVGKCWDFANERIPREVMRIISSGLAVITAFHPYVQPVYCFSSKKEVYPYLELVDVLAKQGNSGRWEVGFSSVTGSNKADKFVLSELLLRTSDGMEFPIVSVNSPKLNEFKCFLAYLYPSRETSFFLEGINAGSPFADIVKRFAGIHQELQYDLEKIEQLYKEATRGNVLDKFHQAWIDK